LVAVPGIWDTQCGFKAFTAEATTEIFGRSQVDRWAFDIEALALARRLGYGIGIVPVHWVDAAGTHVRPGDYLDTLRATLLIRWRLLTGGYRTVISAET
jgi:dolichyl-phosphate beta-glucosyltransferase